MTVENLNKSASWYHGVVDSGLTKYFCDANKSIVFAWIESQQMPVSAGSVIAALQEAESNGGVLNGSTLARVPDERAISAQRDKKAADDAAEKERKRLADVAAQNRHFELVEFVIKHRGVSDPNGLRVERDIVSRWSLEALEQAAAGIRLRQSSRGQSAAEFAKAQGLDKVDSTGREVKKGIGAIPLPDDFTAAKYRKMRPAEIRIFVAKLAQRGFQDRQIWRAIEERVAATSAGQGV